MTPQTEAIRSKTIRPETISVAANLRRCASSLAIAAVAMFTLTGCASSGAGVFQTAPQLASFSFGGEPIADANQFAPWVALESQTTADQTLLDACLNDKAACGSENLVRFRRLLEVAATLPSRDQLNLVHQYFNTVAWTHDTRDTWASVYHTALTKRGDCEDIALAKYQTLRMLGWRPENLRIVVGWDGEEKDWHALVAVQVETNILILDSIKGLQSPSLFRGVRLVYSISDQGVWDHAPDFVPAGTGADRRMASERAARTAAILGQTKIGETK